MVFILKQPQGQSKGIIVFTHKERPFISASVPGMHDVMNALKEQYVLGMHYGWTAKNFTEAPFIDFYLAAEGCVAKPEVTDKTYIRLCSRNFVPANFRPDPDVPKHWDIICVAHTGRFKCLDEFLVTMKQVMDKRPETKVLLIANEHEKPNPVNHYTDLVADYESMFSADQKENFDLMLLKRKQSLYAIKQRSMPFFYNASRVFTLFTNEEGNARVIGEALLCGLPVVCKSYLQGAGRENLNENNARQFDDLESAADVFVDLLNAPQLDMSEEVESLAKEIRDDKTVPKLKRQLKAMFKSMDLPFEGDCDFTNLIRKFSSHTRVLPRHLTHPMTDDLKDAHSVQLYVSKILKVNTEPSFSVQLWDFGYRCVQHLKRIRRKIKN